LPIRPSPKTLEAAFAAFGDVTFAGALVCDNALAAADFYFGAVAELVSTFDALEAAFELVTFAFLITILLNP
jgi:hypothetical protein